MPSTIQTQLIAFLMLVSVVGSTQTLTDEQLFNLIKLSCAPESRVCPQSDFMTIINEEIVWNEDKVMSSAAMKIFKNGEVPREESIAFFRENYCCLDGPCLAICRLFPRIETNLVKNFPKHAKELFDLNLAELEQYRKPVSNFLAGYKDSKARKYPAEVEDFLDHVDANHDRFVSLLTKNRNN